ncbi:hypothetical protein L6164_005850 [Bauhinia variegata]|uniref:Uncharacterized protein n=1 Tax=Bauhinia variegata TaxID=167791 RepID=A0ACB9PUF7_BAUVA|nr:hypothetical protein L6164_005850 [Bauhinia variegata]
MDVIEFSAGSSHSNGKHNLKLSTSTDEGKRNSGKTYRNYHSNGKQNLKQISTFVNHAAIAWHEDRRKWVGDKSKYPSKMPKDPIISWSTSYEELLSTNERFAEPIPLPEMVDFLVDIWHDEGLFD